MPPCFPVWTPSNPPHFPMVLLGFLGCLQSAVSRALSLGCWDEGETISLLPQSIFSAGETFEEQEARADEEATPQTTISSFLADKAVMPLHHLWLTLSNSKTSLGAWQTHFFRCHSQRSRSLPITFVSSN